ncbi:hypothetical protein DYB25_004264 [Aphanomyces astaci]|uniref:Carboxypeptidase n=3 Tax=Aphanomyces astaci TaxID=112090 RepID=A0A397B7F2_APHAT|nr:hypothetical protein DYB25_004264 [Aphanomyces astaci]RHY62999.1 hypothetical protein DYB34_007594 [Aphanomyces astaci]
MRGSLLNSPYMPSFLWAALAALIVAVDPVAGYVAEHKITSLPNYNDDKPINFDQYAGQLALPSTGQRMFYWLVEAETNPDTAPIALWLNGGPGCSSLVGFFTENGPFVVASDLSVKRNPYAWNRHMNMVYLDSPAGVGFSKPLLNASDYNNDVTTARIFEFLGVFFDAYPTYQKRPFYVTGESYNGMYIPYLVHQMVAKPKPTINLAGFAIGNAYTDTHIDGKAYYDWIYSHALISLETYTALKTHCQDDISECSDGTKQCSPECHAALHESKVSSDIGHLNEYYIYGDVCLLNSTKQTQSFTYHRVRPSVRGNIGPCADVFTQAYLRLPQVQQAVHVTDGLVAWSECNDDVSRVFTGSASALDKYPLILSKGLKVLIYSGDADSNTNFIGSERWLTSEGLQLPVVSKWKSWFGPDKQLAGYTQGYQGLNYSTVKGAGHMVPATRPLHGLYLIECFIHGQDVCDKELQYPVDRLEYVSGLVDSVESQHVTPAEWLALVLPLVVAVGAVTWYAWWKRVLVLGKKTLPSTKGSIN